MSNEVISDIFEALERGRPGWEVLPSSEVRTPVGPKEQLACCWYPPPHHTHKPRAKIARRRDPTVETVQLCGGHAVDYLYRGTVAASIGPAHRPDARQPFESASKKMSNDTKYFSLLLLNLSRNLVTVILITIIVGSDQC